MLALPTTFISNDAFREIFQSMSEGIVMANEKGLILSANPMAEEMFGYTTNELNGLLLETLLPERYRGRHENLRHGFNRNPEPRRMGIGRDLTALRKDGMLRRRIISRYEKSNSALRQSRIKSLFLNKNKYCLL